MSIVVLDPGHGGYDDGATGFGLIEKDLALSIAKQTGDFLKQNYLVDVRYTRETDVFIPLSDRAKLANEWQADYFVSIHLNAGGGEGFETYIFLHTQDTQTITMQDMIHQTVMSYLSQYSVTNRGEKEADFAVLRETRMPAILIENLFIDNAKDAGLLKQTEFIRGLAAAIARGIAEAMKLETLPRSDTNPPVQTNRHWAQDAQDDLRKAGFLQNDHTATLDSPATEGMVIELFDRLRKALNIHSYSPQNPISDPASPQQHWAAPANNDLMKAGLLLSDHTKYLDEPATEAMVIVLADRIWKAYQT